MLALASVEGYHGYLMFVWMYGIFFGGMEVTLKTYCYERLKIKQYARGWGYIQGVRALPLLIGKNSPLIVFSQHVHHICGILHASTDM